MKFTKPAFEWPAGTYVHSFATAPRKTMSLSMRAAWFSAPATPMPSISRQLIQGLVPLLEAYEHAMRSGDGQQRLELATAIYQGISPDPELFLNRLDLLSPYSMIEHLFITTGGDGHVAYTPTGQRHLQLVPTIRNTARSDGEAVV